jgi:hypothetical protein
VTDKEGKKIKDEATLTQIEDYIRKVCMIISTNYASSVL